MSETLITPRDAARIVEAPGSRRKRVFISYIAEEKPLAVLFKKWIDQYFMGTCDVFLFEASFAAGTDWMPALRQELIDADVIVPLCSPVSVREEWIICEVCCGWMKDPAGFLPVVHSGMTPTSLPPWLKGITALNANDTGFAEKFILQLSGKLQLRPNPSTAAVDVPEEIPAALAEIQRRQQRYDLFVSAPMSSFGITKYLHWDFRKHITEVVQAFEEKCGFQRVYPKDAAHMPSEAVGIHESLHALERANRFVMIYPERIGSGCLGEAGYALKLRIPCVYFVHQEECLPTFFRNRDNHRVRIEKFKSFKDLVTLVRVSGDRLFDGLE